jgi:aspartyl-tRNA(Asn)/glutamyl-tRNA(Gln) amidotransferase subunit A
MNIAEHTIETLNTKLISKELTVQEVVDAFLSNIYEKNDELNVFIEIHTDFIQEQIKIAQDKIDTGTATILTGIPIAIKDNILIKGEKITAASIILEGYTATYDATVIQKLKAQGAILIPRANMDEFAMGASTEFSAFGVTKNPHDTGRVAGGSSGGSAVAVASGMSVASLGSDTGGSVRQPASFCGVVGLKPTYGSVSRNGLIAMASSFDVIGPITKNVQDAQIIFDAIKGIDPLDQTTVLGEISSEVKKIGVPYHFLKSGIDADVLAVFNSNIEQLKKMGYEIVDISLPSFEYALSIYYILVPAEVSSNMSRFDGVKFGQKVEGKDLIDDYFQTRGQLLGTEVKRRIMLGTYVLSAGYADEYYRKAWVARNAIKTEIKNIFKEVDMIAMPVAPSPAFVIGEMSSDPLKMYLADIFTVSANVAGVPAISIPAGSVERDNKKLPVGLQLLAPWYGEQQLFNVGRKFEIL